MQDAPRLKSGMPELDRVTGGGFVRGSVLLMAGLTAAAAQVSVPLPFSQVPFTFQPMVVLLGGLALGSRLGASAQVLYLLAGNTPNLATAARGEA